MINIDINSIPTLNEAKLLLEEAARLNLGAWVEHSLFVGKASEFLDNIEFTAYDKLIQLCDVLALPTGFCY